MRAHITFLLSVAAFLAFSLTCTGLNAQQRSSVSQKFRYHIGPEMTPTQFITKYVQDSIAVWQKKGRFEKTSQYMARVTEENRARYAARLSKDAEALFIKTYCTEQLDFEMVDYDSDNESYLFRNKKYGDIIVPVAIKYAPDFWDNWHVDSKHVEYYVDGNNVRLKKVPFTSGGNTFYYDVTRTSSYIETNTFVQLPELVLDLTAEELAEGRQQIGSRDVTVGVSDVDVNIPETGSKNEDTYVVIIANENYTRVAHVSYAKNDGNIFKEYCTKTLGIPSENIRMVADATLNDMKHEISWLKMNLKVNGGNAKAIVYYSGHGIPDDATRNAYILPIDGYGTDISTAYSLNTLYGELGNVQSAGVTYFIDACFSGATRDDKMIASAKGVAVKAKAGDVQGNAVVFSAATGDQTAHFFKEEGHGLFTYFLLKKLQDTKGDVNYYDLAEYLKTQVERKSAKSGKLQTPCVTPNSSLGYTWRTWTLK